MHWKILPIITVLGVPRPGGATTVPFTEEFTADSANWFDASGGTGLVFNTAGGPDASSFASGAFNFVGSLENDAPVLFRAQDEFGSSGGAFVGNWITDGVTEFSAFVKHDAPVPLNFFARFASPFNFPGAVAIDFVPVLSDTWTRITIPIDGGNPQFVTFEGSDFSTVFSNIAHVQIGVSVPPALAGINQSFAFGLDKPTIVPEPATVGSLMLGAAIALGGRQRRRERVPEKYGSSSWHAS